MSIPTINQAILWGDISTYLAANDTANGAIYGARKAPTSPVTIAIVTDALRWGVTSQTTQAQRNMANYLIWLIGMYGQQAQSISEGGGGGSVSPVPTEVLSPITISGSDFANATDWNNTGYAGKNVTVFSNGIARYLTYLTEWKYISTGIQILLDGFDSAQMDYTMVITLIR